jgi:hypothetical protein
MVRAPGHHLQAKGGVDTWQTMGGQQPQYPCAGIPISPWLEFLRNSANTSAYKMASYYELAI